MSVNEEATRILADTQKIQSAWLFGSQVSGTATAGSDVDIGLLVSEPLILDDYLRLQSELAECFENESINLSILNTASPTLRFEALSGVNIFCRNQNLQAQFHSRTARDYEESMAMWARGLRYRKEALRSAH